MAVSQPASQMSNSGVLGLCSGMSIECAAAKDADESALYAYRKQILGSIDDKRYILLMYFYVYLSSALNSIDLIASVATPESIQSTHSRQTNPMTANVQIKLQVPTRSSNVIHGNLLE